MPEGTAEKEDAPSGKTRSKAIFTRLSVRREAANQGGGPGTGQKGNGRVNITGAEAGRLVSGLAIGAETENKSGSPSPKKGEGLEIESSEPGAFCGSELSCVWKGRAGASMRLCGRYMGDRKRG